MSATAQVIQFPSERRQASRLLTLTELREHFGYSERWFRYRLAEGLPARRWGGRLRFDAVEVERWLEARYGKA
jgi:predicted DNA-binding transcriptional regulator AlpA